MAGNDLFYLSFRLCGDFFLECGVNFLFVFIIALGTDFIFALGTDLFFVAGTELFFGCDTELFSA